jgi:Melibiase
MRQLNWRRWRPFHRFVAYATLNGAWVVGAACKCPAADSPTIENEFLRVSATDAHGGFSIVPKPSAKGVTVSGQLANVDGNAATKNVSDAIFGSGESLQWDNARMLIFSKLPFALVRETLKNDTSKAAVRNKIEFASLKMTLPSPVSDLKILGTGGLTAADKNSGSYAWLVVAEPKSRNAVVAGWLTCDRGSGVLFSEAGPKAIAIKARSDYGRLHLAPGAETETETLAIGYFDDGRLGLEAWADAVAKTYHIKLPEQPSGFCTWYAEKHGGAADEKSLAELAEFAAKKLKPFGFNFVQIDDHWQQGEKKNGPTKNFTAFRSPGPYGSGMKPMADKLKQLGLRPGIWFMPFAGTYNDPWFENHQDWFAKKPDGKPYDVSWGGTSLDMTKPEVRDYIRGIVKQIAHDWGFTYFKMDGLYTGMAINPRYPNAGYKDDDLGDAVFADPNKTNVEVYRDGLKLIRETAGPRRVLFGLQRRPKHAHVCRVFRALGRHARRPRQQRKLERDPNQERWLGRPQSEVRVTPLFPQRPCLVQRPGPELCPLEHRFGGRADDCLLVGNFRATEFQQRLDAGFAGRSGGIAAPYDRSAPTHRTSGRLL